MRARNHLWVNVRNKQKIILIHVIANFVYLLKEMEFEKNQLCCLYLQIRKRVNEFIELRCVLWIFAERVTTNISKTT